MNDRTDVIAAVLALYADRVRGDVEALVSRFAPDGFLRLAGFPGDSPGPALREGKSALRQSLRNLCDDFAFLEQEAVEFVIEGDKAAVHSRVKVRHNASGQEAVTELLDLFTFADGHIVSLLEFCDTALVVRMHAAS